MTRRCRALAVAVALAVAPAAARADDAGDAPPEPAPEVVAEALFLCDHLPPGGRDVNVTLGVARGEPDPVTGDAALAVAPRVQLAMALGERVGFTADVGFATDGKVLDTPGASLKLLLQEPVRGRTGLAASVDLYGSTHSLEETEAGVGVGAIRAIGPVGVRAAATLASGVSSWSPHLHLGASGAIALGARWRLLGEVVSEVAGGEALVSAGPTVKVALGERTALMAGALFPVAQPGAAPAFALQLTQGL